MAVQAPTLRKVSRTVLLTVYSLIVLVPLTVVLFTTVKTSPQMYASPFGLPTSPTLDNFGELLEGGRLTTSFLNSVVVTVFSVALTLFISSLAAFAIARIHGWLGISIFGLFALGLAVPAQVAMIPQYVIFKQIGLTNSLVGLVLINIAVTCPVAIFIMTGFLKTLPTELFEAAEIDGAGQWRTYHSIALPLAAPSVAAVAIFLFVMHWNDLLLSAALHHRSEQGDTAQGAPGLQGGVHDELPGALRWCPDRQCTDGDCLHLPATVFRCRYHRGRDQGLIHSTLVKG
jgi:raffinose/stachyose/melibiose transport system permease protein